MTSQVSEKAFVTLDDVVRTGPGTLGGRYMRSFWQPVYVASKLEPGAAVPIRAMSESYTLYRGEGEGGNAHVVAFRCAHRGTQLSTGWVEGEEIRCFYHGWRYNAAGQCTVQPAENPGMAANVRIRSYATEEYLGLIFAYLGEGEAPPLPRYLELEEEGVLQVNDVVVWPCNYFNRVENSADEVHVIFVHSDSEFSENGLIHVPDVSAEETEFGFTGYASRSGGGPVRVTHFHMPNINYIKGSPATTGGPWTDHLSWRVPVDDEHCASYTVDLTHITGPEAEEFRIKRERRAEAAQSASASMVGPLVLDGKLRIKDIKERAYIINVQDYVAQVGQGPIADRANERLGKSDRVVVLLRQLWLRDLQAIADGQQRKQWRRSGRLLATSGV